MHSAKNVDSNKLAIIGTMAGASGILFAVKNLNVDAIVSLDGSYEQLQNNLDKMPYYEPLRLRAPLLHFSNKHYDPIAQHPFFEKLQSSSVTQVQFLQLEHPDLYGQRMASFSASPIHQEGYETMAAITLQYLNNYVKKMPSSAGELSKLLTATNAFISVKQKPASIVAPFEEEFSEMILLDGVEKSVLLYRSIKERNPDYRPFTEQLISTAWTLYNRGMQREAIKVVELVMEGYPTSTWAQGTLETMKKKAP
jgi:hypothetical protein